MVATKLRAVRGTMKISSLGIISLVSVVLFSGAVASADQTYLTPIWNGRQIDRCVNSPRFPDRCSDAAASESARHFCILNGHRDVKQWQTFLFGVNDEDKPPVWIWNEYWSGGVFHQNYGDWRGGNRFTVIECSD
jgi:hypothetical protein